MLLRRPAAVDAEHGTGRIAGRVACEVNGRALDFLQIPPTLERGSAHDEFLALFRIRNGHVHRRKKRAGADGVDGDAFLGQFHGQRTGEHYRAAFAAAIRRAVGDRHEAQRAGEVDDTAVLFLFHVRQNRAAGEPGAVHINALHLGKFLVAHLIDWPADVDTCAIYKDIDPAIFLQTLGDHGLHVGLFGHIGSEPYRLAAVFGGDFVRGGLSFLGIATDEHEVCSSTSQTGAHRLTQSFGAAGDDCHAIGEFE